MEYRVSQSNGRLPTLRRVRWLIVLGWSVAVLLALAGSLSPLTAYAFWPGLFLNVFTFPVGLWCLLAVLPRAQPFPVRADAQWRWHAQLARQLILHQEWDELTGVVAHLPLYYLPVEAAALYLYDHRRPGLECVRVVGRLRDSVWPGPLPAGDVCETCLAGRPRQLHQAAACPFFGASGAPNTAEYCLPLECGNLLIGVLRFRCQPGMALNPEAADFLNRAASDVALALVLALARPQELAQARTAAQLDERRYVAFELHNSLAQQVGYLHLNLDRLAIDGQRIPEPAVRQELERMRAVADDAHQVIRGLLTRLRTDGHFDLSSAIADYSQAVARQADLQVDLTMEGRPRRLPPGVSYGVFGLVREGLNNVERHAQAQRVQIAVQWTPEVLRVRVADDGRGFVPAATPGPAAGHYGLAMLREQARALGGTLAIISAPDQGTCLEFTLTLRPEPERAAPLPPADSEWAGWENRWEALSVTEAASR